MSEPFSLLMRVAADEEMNEVFSSQSAIDTWVEVEVALARAQAQLGVIPESAAVDIQGAAERIRRDDEAASRIWAAMRTVGYPILGLVREIEHATAGDGAGRVHFGATTQDVMDSGFAIQLQRSTALFRQRLLRFGERLSELVSAERTTIMAGRTHARHAVPTTLGLKFAIYLSQVADLLQRLDQERPRAERVSLFGAAGTSAALGPLASETRRRLAELLGLEDAVAPWHVARGAIFAQTANAVEGGTIAGRLARELIDLGRTELGELDEPAGEHRGASSTMPQKQNPILGEQVIAAAATASSLLPALARAMEAQHERAAGEWLIEWHAVPQAWALASSAVANMTSALDGLQIRRDRMAKNMELDGFQIMAEAAMMALAPSMGRDRAHEAVYRACHLARDSGITLEEALRVSGLSIDVGALDPATYLGEAQSTCDRVLVAWSGIANRAGVGS